MAVEEASFKISMEAISAGLISFKLPFISGNPSTTYNGSFPDCMEPAPRIRNMGDSPGALLVNTATPGARPCNDSSGLFEVTAVISAALTEVTEPVRSLFF